VNLTRTSIQLGTALFSFTPDVRRGATAVELLEGVAAAGCGPAVEVIGQQVWRGFPQLSDADERAFRDTVDRLGLDPVALGVYDDTFRQPHRPLSTEQAFEGIRAQLAVAARLGFRVVRGTLGMEPVLLRRVAEEAESRGLVLTFEVQGATAPDAPAVAEVVSLAQLTGSPYLGLTLDFSVTTPQLPTAFSTALGRLGLAKARIAAVHRIWAEPESLGRRIGAALGWISGHPAEAELENLIAGVFTRTGRSQPADWTDLLPYVRHAHAKSWDADPEPVRSPHGAWIAALDAAGYSGAVVSEWGGHELLARSDADALTVTREHHALLTELLEQTTVVTA
jgi:sugar phosphate isomerase/epimerase